ncbi:MAG: acetolactate synthase large subunit [Acidimicrobiia bacterium]|nr:acetolactate synthase large subunit [Acidimicrobiia bacterium]
MNGARSLLRTLVDHDVDVCFANPGTSEMHFVAALDDEPRMRAVLGLFEGVVTGAADGYARMTGRPAATLLHLGPGLGNGIANLHNARRAHVPMINIVGDHATYHQALDAPLQSDIETLAANVSGWVRRSGSTDALARDTADAVVAARTPPGEIATLILPADVSWGEGGQTVARQPFDRPLAPDLATIEAAAKILCSGEPSAILVGNDIMRDELSLALLDAVAASTGSKVLAEVFPTRIRRGAGIAAADRLAYLAEFAAMQLDGLRHLILLGAQSPVTFFAYPGKASDLVPDGCDVHVVTDVREDGPEAVEALADAVGVTVADARLAPSSRSDRPTGELTGAALAAAVSATLPEDAIVVDEAQTGGIWASPATAGCPPHDWLTLTGGSIGFGMPCATGAAVACPDRPVINLQADGSAMYTAQALWTQAREGLDVTTVIFANRSYAILNMELSRVGVESPGPIAKSMLDLTGPELDFVALARGMGVPAVRPEDADSFTAALERAAAEPGPHLIEAVIPSGF